MPHASGFCKKMAHCRSHLTTWHQLVESFESEQIVRSCLHWNRVLPQPPSFLIMSASFHIRRAVLSDLQGIVANNIAMAKASACHYTLHILLEMCALCHAWHMHAWHVHELLHKLHFCMYTNFISTCARTSFLHVHELHMSGMLPYCRRLRICSNKLTGVGLVQHHNWSCAPPSIHTLTSWSPHHLPLPDP